MNDSIQVFKIRALREDFGTVSPWLVFRVTGGVAARWQACLSAACKVWPGLGSPPQSTQHRQIDRQGLAGRGLAASKRMLARSGRSPAARAKAAAKVGRAPARQCRHKTELPRGPLGLACWSTPYACWIVSAPQKSFSNFWTISRHGLADTCCGPVAHPVIRIIHEF